MQPLWKTLRQFLTKLNIVLTYDPAIVLLAIYSSKWKTHTHTKACTQIFIAALFIIAKGWLQPICPSLGERINKLVHPDNGIFFRPKKK